MAVPSAPVARSQRFTRDSPCPACGGYPEAPRGHDRIMEAARATS